MDPSEKEPHFSEHEDAIASMATIARTLSPPDIASHEATSAHANEHVVSSTGSHANGIATGPRMSSISSKYTHIAAVHSRVRISCLSRDTEETPNFLGFRNLMVIVLSTCSVFAKSCDPGRKCSQIGLIKSSYSCNESTTGHRKLHEGKGYDIYSLIDATLTGSPVWSSHLYTLPRLSPARLTSRSCPLPTRSLPSLRRLYHRTCCRTPSQRCPGSRQTAFGGPSRQRTSC